DQSAHLVCTHGVGESANLSRLHRHPFPTGPPGAITSQILNTEFLLGFRISTGVHDFQCVRERYAIHTPKIATATMKGNDIYSKLPPVTDNQSVTAKLSKIKNDNPS